VIAPAALCHKAVPERRSRDEEVTSFLAGTSGYSYPEWKGKFYPKDLSPKKMLAFYASKLPAVEINNTFYKRPTKEQLEAWANETPASFKLAFKASRYFSAGTGLRDPKAIGEFFALLSHVKARLGPVLVALPPHVKKDLGMLRGFLTAAGKHRVALDLEDPSWNADDTRALLKTHDAAWCVTEDDERSPALVTTATWTYVRLRKPRYDKPDLRRWAERIEETGVSEAYVFFKHEATGPASALELLGRR
jgi:uncharacterized protein YecE (DUF72 family)